jgi:hypothetical protein
MSKVNPYPDPSTVRQDNRIANGIRQNAQIMAAAVEEDHRLGIRMDGDHIRVERNLAYTNQMKALGLYDTPICPTPSKPLINLGTTVDKLA